MSCWLYLHLQQGNYFKINHSIILTIDMNTFLLLIVVLCLSSAQQVEVLNPDGSPRQQQPEYTADDADLKVQQLDSEISKEIEDARKVMVNRNHSQHYGFLLNASIDQEFVFAVDVDEEMEAIIIVYWESGDTFVMSKKQEGEEIRVLVYEDSSRLIGSWGFYHAGGITFHAKKEHEYLMKIITKGRNKMLVMDVENFVYKGSSQHIASKAHVEPHEQKMKSLQERLVSYMTVTQSNHIINELIAENVRLHMKRYMVYQILEGLLILVFAVAQGYFIRKLLTKGYSIV